MFKASNTFFSVLKRFLRCFPLLIENISFWEGELPWDPYHGHARLSLCPCANPRGDNRVPVAARVCPSPLGRCCRCLTALTGGCWGRPRPEPGPTPYPLFPAGTAPPPALRATTRGGRRAGTATVTGTRAAMGTGTGRGPPRPRRHARRQPPPQPSAAAAILPRPRLGAFPAAPPGRCSPESAVAARSGGRGDYNSRQAPRLGSAWGGGNGGRRPRRGEALWGVAALRERCHSTAGDRETHAPHLYPDTLIFLKKDAL